MASLWDTTEFVTMVLTPPETVTEERVFVVYLGNPLDVELVSIELNGVELSILTATQMGYSITRIP